MSKLNTPHIPIEREATEEARLALIQQVVDFQERVVDSKVSSISIETLLGNIKQIPAAHFAKESTNKERIDYIKKISGQVTEATTRLQAYAETSHIQAALEQANNIAEECLKAIASHKRKKNIIAYFLMGSSIVDGLSDVDSRISRFASLVLAISMNDVIKQTLSALPWLALVTNTVASISRIAFAAFISKEGTGTRLVKGLLSLGGLALITGALLVITGTLLIATYAFTIAAYAMSVAGALWEIGVDLKSRFISGRYKKTQDYLEKNKERFYDEIRKNPDLVKDVQAGHQNPHDKLTAIATLDATITAQENYLRKRNLQSAERVHSLIKGLIGLTGAILLLTPVTFPIGLGILIGIAIYSVAPKLAAPARWLGLNALANVLSWNPVSAMVGDACKTKEHHASMGTILQVATAQPAVQSAPVIETMSKPSAFGSEGHHSHRIFADGTTSEPLIVNKASPSKSCA